MRDIPDKIDSKFRFVLLSSHRAEQMLRGGLPKTDHGKFKLTRAAMEEIFEELVEWDYGPAEEPVIEASDESEAAADGAEGEAEASAAPEAAESA